MGDVVDLAARRKTREERKKKALRVKRKGQWLGACGWVIVGVIAIPYAGMAALSDWWNK